MASENSQDPGIDGLRMDDSICCASTYCVNSLVERENNRNRNKIVLDVREELDI